MDNELFNLKTIKILNRLVKAADKAHSTGKQQALSKIIVTLSKLTARLNESTEKKLSSENFEYLDCIFNDEFIDTDYYTKVDGILVD